MSRSPNDCKEAKRKQLHATSAPLHFTFTLFLHRGVKFEISFKLKKMKKPYIFIKFENPLSFLNSLIGLIECEEK